ncbi:MAG: transporter [Hyphomicrobiaceae bacterium]
MKLTPNTVPAVIASLAAASIMSTTLPGPAGAAEQATSVYLLGSKGSMAGFIPPPGTYLVDSSYSYSGSASGSAALGVTAGRTGTRDTANVPLLLEADLNVDARAYYQMPTVVWVAPQPVLGGHVGFSLTTPIGWKDVGFDLGARATFTLPSPINRTIQAGRQFSESDDRTAFGDPVASAFIGWHQGPWHWNVGTMVNVPLGAWDAGRLANIGFNHWAVDTTGSLTWLDPKVGIEVSLASGFTFNFENPDSNYKSGTDFHAELAVMRHFSPQLAIGVVGYHYQQVTGDSGAGAILGDFKGRVTALGPSLNYTFQLGPVPINTKLSWYHEFNEENRLKGDAGLLSVTLPLGGPPPAPAPGLK